MAPHATPMPAALASGFPVLIVGAVADETSAVARSVRRDRRRARGARAPGRRDSHARRRRGRDRRARRAVVPGAGVGPGVRERRGARADPAHPEGPARARAGASRAARLQPRGDPPGAARDRRAGGGLHLGARGQLGLHRRAHRRGGAPLPEHDPAAVLRPARELRRHPRVLVAHAGPHRRHGVHEVGGRPRLPRLLRRADAALGPVGLGGRARVAERPLRPGRRGGALRRARLRRRPDVLRDRRQLGEQPDHPALGRRGRRHRAGRPQLPQVLELRAERERRRSGLSAPAPQPARRDRPGPVHRARARDDPQEARGESAGQGPEPQAGDRGAHELDLRRALLRRRAHDASCSARASTASTTTRPGTRTRASTRSTRAATACTAATARPTTRR